MYQRAARFSHFVQVTSDRACPVNMILGARGEQPETLFVAGDAFIITWRPSSWRLLRWRTALNSYLFV